MLLLLVLACLLQPQPIISPSVCGAVQYCEVIGARHVVVRGDSELIVKQMKGINRWALRQHREALVQICACCGWGCAHLPLHIHRTQLPFLAVTSQFACARTPRKFQHWPLAGWAWVAHVRVQ